MTVDHSCELCREVGGQLLWKDTLCRVVRVPDVDYPATVRVILNAHVRELTDLSSGDRRRLMDIVFLCEEVMIRELEPAKMNVASLGNLCPHVHWHLIPRKKDDRHFPRPVWSAPVKDDAGSSWSAKTLALLEERLGDELVRAARERNA